MTMEIPKPFIPNIPNTHALVETIAQNQGETTRAMLKRLDQLIALRERQNELLLQLVQGQLPKV